ncbi:MAG: hypothetical protein CMI16_10315 [Opitutaceae bacterium]|nr:hypothetical protein [Opitutaceae bacterium]
MTNPAPSQIGSIGERSALPQNSDPKYFILTPSAGLLNVESFEDKRITLGANQFAYQRNNPTKGNTMGDRSPKSNQKQASQKQSKNDTSNKQKQAQLLSQQAAKAKLAANKKK